jgi:membrane protein YqaA with SNARE-associated domain
MPVPKKLTVVFTFFYLIIIIYLFLFITVPPFKGLIIESRKNIAQITQGSNYAIAIILSIFICFIGNASIGFPIPYPFILFSFSQSIYLKYSNLDLNLVEILTKVPFWLEILGLAIAGGFGSILGELVSYIVGVGAKKIAEKKSSNLLQNVQGFGRLVLEHPKSMYFVIFLAAALPIPDDPLWIALGMSNRKFSLFKSVLSGWMGKNITTFFYVCLPFAIILGFNASGIEIDDTSSVITEALTLLISLSVMLFILSFNWDKYLDKKYRTVQSMEG